MVTRRLDHTTVVCLATAAVTVIPGCSHGPSDTTPPHALPPAQTSTPRTSPSGTAPSETPSSGTPSTVSPPSPDDVRTLAVKVYLAMWADMVEAATTSDYTSPRLADHADAQALLLLSGMLRAAHDHKVVVKGTPRFSPVVTAVTPSRKPIAVSLRDCADGSSWLSYRLDGRLQDDVPGGRHLITATVGLYHGRWVVTRLSIGAVGTCP